MPTPVEAAAEALWKLDCAAEDAATAFGEIIELVRQVHADRVAEITGVRR
jgi:hypothetical protein